MAPRITRTAIVLLCATAVLVVLITPAFDELPTTLPHHLHGVLPATAMIALLPGLALGALQSVTLSLHFVSAQDLLSLNCTRIC